MNKKTFVTSSAEETKQLGKKLARFLSNGGCIELTSDLGGGKTTFVSGLAEGLASQDPVASPSFTICNTYARRVGGIIYHFDFYRLEEAGIVAEELAEAVSEEGAVVVVEWGGIVHEILPKKRFKISIEATDDQTRVITIVAPETIDMTEVAI